MIHRGSLVTLEYRAYTEDGIEIERTQEGEPMKYKLGEGRLLPEIEHTISKMQLNDNIVMTLSPDQAFGPINEKAFQEVDLTTVPEGYRQEGAILGLQSKDGEHHQARVHALTADKAVLDFNHPLAGKTLTIYLHLLAIK